MILALFTQIVMSTAAIIWAFADAFHSAFVTADIFALLIGMWIAAHGNTTRDRIRRRFLIYAIPLFLLIPAVHFQLYAAGLQQEGIQRFVMGALVIFMPALAFHLPHLISSGVSILVRAWRRNQRRELLRSQQRIARQ